MKRTEYMSLFAVEYRVGGGALWNVKSRAWIPGDTDKTTRLFTVPLSPNFGCIFFENIHCSQTQPHYQHEEARRREAIDCVTFPQAPGCEDSLWVRLSITDSGTSTWKDSMYKAAGAEGESCTGIQSPLLCPAVFFQLCLTLNVRPFSFQIFLICLLISIYHPLMVCIGSR